MYSFCAKCGYISDQCECKTGSVGEMKPLLNKNEYIALELTKAWAGQGGLPCYSDKIVDTYKAILNRLYLDSSESK